MTAGARHRRRGAPLLALALVLSGWVALRAAVWAAWPGPAPLVAGGQGQPVRMAGGPQPTGAVAEVIGAASERRDGWRNRPLPTRFDAAIRPAPWAESVEPPSPAGPLVSPRPQRPVMEPVPARLAGGHAMMWLAAVSQLPVPSVLLEQSARARARAAQAPSAAPWSRAATVASPQRWSADAWAMVRGGGSGGSSAAAFGPTYGASQVGAVLRYRLAPESRHRPTAYLRATAALAGPDREVAAGLSLRPIPQLPVAIAGEGRLSRIGGGAELRPAVVAITEFAPITLPAKVRAEFYAQGGYVGGRSATAFVDGALRVDRKVAQVGRIELRAGAGAWGGAQEGAQRLDIGPSATLGITQGRGAARLALDWRLRVAGDAAPASGPALTISAGF